VVNIVFLGTNVSMTSNQTAAYIAGYAWASAEVHRVLNLRNFYSQY
jgi:hypothetical protein